jgi:hypothetical protein
MLHPLFDCSEFASAAMQKRLEEHDASCASLMMLANGIERDIAALEEADPFTTDLSDLTGRMNVLRGRRQIVAQAEMTLLQARLTLLEELQRDKASAHEAAIATLQRERQEVRDGLLKLGFRAWLSQTDSIVQSEIGRIVDFASGPDRALARLEIIRDASTSLSAEYSQARHQLAEMADAAKQRVRNALTRV